VYPDQMIMRSGCRREWQRSWQGSVVGTSEMYNKWWCGLTDLEQQIKIWGDSNKKEK